MRKNIQRIPDPEERDREAKRIIANEILIALENMKYFDRQRIEESLKALERLYRAGILLDPDSISGNGAELMRQICGDILDVLDHLDSNGTRWRRIANDLCLADELGAPDKE